MMDKLKKLFNELDQEERRCLVAFAEFLCQRQHDDNKPVMQEPQPIERPSVEGVPAALQRLKAVYPMLEASDLLAEASELMTQYLMQGRDVDLVIDELEALFKRHYEIYKSGYTD